MRSFILTTCIFWALLATVQSKTCRSCCSQNSETCEKESVIDCGSKDCITIHGFVEYGSTVTKSFYKGCLGNYECDSWLCISSNPFKLQSFIQCCSGDECNTGTYEMPVDNEGYNGRTCPSCYEEGTLEECTADSQVKCRGDETQCILFVGTVVKPDKSEVKCSFKGCNNPGAFTHLDAFKSLRVLSTTKLENIKGRSKKNKEDIRSLTH
ncbi:phospholipase A2 inhibitor and Ly6/PLAUR domain-containing protein-like [Discoglossus pictus]